VSVFDESGLVTRNPDAWTGGGKRPRTGEGGGGGEGATLNTKFEPLPYRISQSVQANAYLTKHLKEHVTRSIGAKRCIQAKGFTTDSFYSSQGRVTKKHFEDRNNKLIPEILAAHPTGATMDMESFHLLDLSRCAVGPNLIAAGSAVVVVCNRRTGEVADESLLESDGRAGTALLRAVASVGIGDIFEGVDINGDDDDDVGGGSDSSGGSPGPAEEGAEGGEGGGGRQK
jgi:hypothetical protein